MPRIEMGNGFRNLAYFIMFSLMAGTFYYFGGEQEKGKQRDTNIEVISIDSIEGQKINVDTKKEKEELNENIESLNEPVIDSNGYVSAEFMQLMESAKSNAERRGNETSFIYELTKP